MKSSNGLWSNWIEKSFESVNIDTNPKTAAEVTAMGYIFNKTANGTYSIKSYNGSKASGRENILIPSSIDGVMVTEIATASFRSNDYLHSVVVPKSVKTIYRVAFAQCDNLKKIWIPEGAKFILEPRDQAHAAMHFYYCPTSLRIYCEAPSQPSGWFENWNLRHDYSDFRFPVKWGVSLEDFNNLP